MRWIKARWIMWRAKRQIRNFKETAKMVLERGNVREMRMIAEGMRVMGERLELPDVILIADDIEAHAEAVVLARVFKR